MTLTTHEADAAARLRRATEDIHRLTEQEPFVVDLLAGRRRIEDYTALASQLRWVYAALEDAVATTRPTTPPAVAAMFDPRLDRLAALDGDLETLRDPGAAVAPPIPATTAYVARIHAAVSDWPRLVAHHYVRYLGDLSGGQIVAAMLRRHYGLGDDALRFYAFDDLGSKGGFKTRYRAHLDAVLADPAAFERAADEAGAAYAANRAIFAALG